MAGTWRVQVEGAEGLQLPSSGSDGLRHALHAIGARDVPARLAFLEVISSGSISKTRRFEVLEDGSAAVHEVLFVPAPRRGEPMQIRALKCHKDVLIGEADVLVTAAGKFRITLKRSGRGQGALVVSISQGLPEAQAPQSVSRATNSGTRSRGVAPAEAKSNSNPPLEGSEPPPTASAPLPLPPPPSGARDREPVGVAPTEAPHRPTVPQPGHSDRKGTALPPPPAPPQRLRPLRRRHPDMPSLGTCEVAIEAVEGLGEAFAAPHLIVSLEGQEFRAVLDSMPPFVFQFDFASLQRDLQIYCHDDRLRQGPVGRILIPLANLAWSAGESPSFERVLAVFEKDPACLQRRYVCQFLPASEDCHDDPAHVDRYDPRLLGAKLRGQEIKWVPFGSVTLKIKLNLAPSVNSLAKLYGKSFITNMGMSAMLQDRALLPFQSPGSQSSLVGDAELRSLLLSLMRLRLFFIGVRGWSHMAAWLREEKWRGYAAAVLWFLFCILGFFPPPLWRCPIYAWLAILFSGLLAHGSRQSAVSSPQASARELGQMAPCTVHQIEVAETVREMEPIARGLVSCLERARSLFTFGDGPASVVLFAATGVLALAASLSLLLATWIETVSFISGAYGAVLLILVAKKKPAGSGAASPMLGSAEGKPALPDFLLARRLGMALELLVPDEAELGHRLVAARLQIDAPTEAPAPPSPGGSSCLDDPEDALY